MGVVQILIRYPLTSTRRYVAVFLITASTGTTRRGTRRVVTHCGTDSTSAAGGRQAGACRGARSPLRLRGRPMLLQGVMGTISLVDTGTVSDVLVAYDADGFRIFESAVFQLS